MRESNQSIIEEEKLFEQLCSNDLLRNAFQEVKRNKGAAGIDRVTIEIYELRLDENLEQLSSQLKSWNYRPKPVRRVEIPKPNGGIRPLGIPCIHDRVVQAAIKMLLEPILDPRFSPNSYGFRPGRNQEQAVQAAKRIISSGKEYVVDVDITKFFDKIHHDKLISRLSAIVSDKRILRIIGMTLRSGIMHHGVIEVTEEGSIQGSPLSPLLSNLVLDELDKELERRGLEFCRFADDFNIFVSSQKAAERVMEKISEFIKRKLSLEVNKEKSKVAPASKVKFLGMTIITMTIAISLQSMNRAMAKVKELIPRGTNRTIREDIKTFNRWYTGWSSYYKMTEYPTQLSLIEAHARRRFRARLVGQQKRRRHLLETLKKRGVPGKIAAQAAYSNKRRWGQSLTKGVNMAFPNKWFSEEMGFKTRSGEKLPHWKSLKTWVRLS